MSLIAELRTLERLKLQGCPITGKGLQQLTTLAKLTTLELFYIETLKDEDLDSLRNSTSLRRIELGGTRITDAGLRYVAACNSLVDVGLSGCPITGNGLRPLNKLEKLTRLDISKNHSLTDEDLKELQGCRSLSELDISETHISDAGLLNLIPLPKLRQVAVGKSEPTANDKSGLEKGVRPETKNRITDKGRAAFKKERPDVEISVALPRR